MFLKCTSVLQAWSKSLLHLIYIKIKANYKQIMLFIYFFSKKKKFFADEKLLSNIIISTGLPYKYLKSEFDIYYNIYNIIRLYVLLIL